MRKSVSGFTIVELLIVVVVIAILAAISIVAYTGIQNRAQDTRRLSDMRAIATALEQYKVDNGRYPADSYSGLGNQSGWENSAREASGQFIASLNNSYGFSGQLPVDPINNSLEATFAEARTNGTYAYYYHRYPAGTNGCDAARGAYYILGVTTTQTASTTPHPDSPGFVCAGGHSYQSWFSWVTGGYEN